MMGERDPQAPIWSYRVNLDKRVRSDHPLRRINDVLDLSFVRTRWRTPMVGGAINQCHRR
jgi:hypothetical protein